MLQIRTRWSRCLEISCTAQQLRLCMFKLVFILALYSSQFLHSSTINRTQVQICSSKFTNCTDNSTNCTSIFYNCMEDAEIKNKRPQSCYQADAAGTCFRTAVQVSAAIFGASILAAIMPTVINWIHSAKCWDGCCSSCGLPVIPEGVERIEGEDPSNPEKDTFKLNIVDKEALKSPSNLEYLKKLSTVTFGQIAAYFSIAISFASAGQLFNLWQAWTVATANCEFDMTK